MARPTLDEIPKLSRFVERTLSAEGLVGETERRARLETWAASPVTREALAEQLDRAETSEVLARRLREVRRDLMAVLIVRNATGAADYFEVVRTMSDFAEEAVARTVAVHVREAAARYGVPFGASGEPTDLLVVGMGKLGGRELNVSSDIDLIFLYNEDGETRPTEEFPDVRRTLSVQEFYERAARRIIPALNDIEGPGFVFRVDMRLRPNGESGPIVGSSDMLEEYLYAQGRDWERFAWLKGRIVNRPVFSSPEVFERHATTVASIVRPFVFRKYLDFGAIASLTKLHEMVRAETDRRELARGLEGVNVKLGRGGIREIEFITQTQQVIRGGRDERLRGKETLAMLAALADEGVVSRETAQRLREEYVFLRDVEHALQYVDDQQTQWLPRSGDVLERAAGLLGLTPEALWERIESVREFVARAFDSVFQVGAEKASGTSGWPVGWYTGTSTARSALGTRLLELGYPEEHLAELSERIAALVTSRMALRSEEAQGRMRRLVEFVVEKAPSWCGAASARILPPSEVLGRYLKLLEAIAGRSTYVALLYQYPRAAERVGRVLAASRWSADYMVRHPIVLDELVDGRVREMDDFSPVDWSAWRDELHSSLRAAEGDVERQMNLLRDAHHAAVFRLLIADLDGHFTVERLADQLSALADATVAETVELAWASLVDDPEVRPAHFAVIGYGKLGGKELGYQSDLDLVFVYDDPDPDADRLYSRLVRRMMSWLTVQTSSGKLFDVDLRLRPNGENGLAVCSFEAFSRYQRNADGNGAWFWEHQALTRARFVAGDAALGERFERERREVLRMPRTPESVRRDVLAMREKMLEGHSNRSEAFDLKHDRGGMVDVEFAVQCLVLTHAATHPELMNNFGNILLLEMAARAGLVDERAALEAVAAYRRYRMLQHEIRLNAGEGMPARVPHELVADEIRTVRTLWRAVFETDGPERT